MSTEGPAVAAAPALPEPMPAARRAAYALGSAGWQITDRIVVSIAVYFYLPPEGRGLDTLVPEDVVLGVVTFFGLAMFLGRLVDTAADPLVAHASDRSRSPRGRRRVFLLWGALPMAVLPVLLFFPVGGPGSVANVVWLGALLALYFVFFTVYVGPYLALLPELAWDQEERVSLSTWVALGQLAATILAGVGWVYFFDLGRRAGLAAPDAMRALVIALSALAFVLCVAPILAVDERRFALSQPSDLSLGRALGLTLRNRPFLLYLAAQLLFIFGVTLVQPAAPYLATVILGRSEAFAAVLGAVTFGGIAVGFALNPALVRRLGPKGAMLVCTGAFAVCVSLLGLLEVESPGGPRDARNLTLAFTSLALIGIPIAGLVVLPYVLISQLIDEDEARTGANRSGMFFGIQGFLTKWMYGLSLWVFSFLLQRFGKSPGEPLGVLLVGPVAGGACLLALGLYALYPERRVLAGARRDARP